MTGKLIQAKKIPAFIALFIIFVYTFTSNNNNEYINNILFHLPITNTAYGSLNTYTCTDMIMFKSRQLPYCISSFSIILYDDKFQHLELLPSAIVALELAIQYEQDGTNVL